MTVINNNKQFENQLIKGLIFNLEMFSNSATCLKESDRLQAEKGWAERGQESKVYNFSKT